MAANLGEITLYAQGFDLKNEHAAGRSCETSLPWLALDDQDKQGNSIRPGSGGMSVYDRQQELRPAFTAGSLPAAGNSFDHVITFGTPLPFVDWATGEQTKAGALLRVQTRPSVLYARLFAALGDFATGVEYMLLFAAMVFAIIELLALLIGTRLTRTVTGAVAQLYNATKHINRGDFSHRISVKSNDQLATLANSFNSMTASIENLIEEQKEKQRLQNELTIAQEVQAQLYPAAYFATGFAGGLRLLPSRAHRERRLLRFPHPGFGQAHPGGGGRQRERNFRGPADGDDPFGGPRLQPGGHAQPKACR